MQNTDIKNSVSNNSMVVHLNLACSETKKSIQHPPFRKISMWSLVKRLIDRSSFIFIFWSGKLQEQCGQRCGRICKEKKRAVTGRGYSGKEC